MIASGQLRGLAWTALAAVACALLFALSLHVNALKSKVRQTELRIVALKHEKLYLETEFETRANQQQLETWNKVDFGYVAPGPGQFIGDDRELAALGKPLDLPASAPTSAMPPGAAVRAPVRLVQRPSGPARRPAPVGAVSAEKAQATPKARRAEKAPVGLAAAGKPQPADTRPAKTKRAETKSAETKSVKARPAKPQPTKVQQAKVQQAKVQQAKAQPAKPQPAKGQPAGAKPERLAEDKSDRPRKVAAMDVQLSRSERAAISPAKTSPKATEKTKEERGR